MYYITVKLPPTTHQMTIEELLYGVDLDSLLINSNLTNTRTYEVQEVKGRFLDTVDTGWLIKKLNDFNTRTERLHWGDRHSLYREFHIPKKSGGLRKIDAPNDDLMNALREIKTIFENDFHALYHTSAFAYIPRRSTIECMKRHQRNESKWFAKYDLSNFFGSTTKEFVMHQLSMIYPFCEVMKRPDGNRALGEALDLAFLDGVLPQGTPLSPLLTNIIMIPIDYRLANTLREYNNQRFVYTRYADDFQVSSRYSFRFREIERVIVGVLDEFDAPFKLNRGKTRYGSSAGRNWNLGLMINKDNNLTVGHKKKKQLKNMLENYAMDKKHGVSWDISDVQVMEGYRNYYRQVEEESIDELIKWVNKKHDVDILELISIDLRG